MPGTTARTRPHRRLSSNNSLLRHNNRVRMFSRSISDDCSYSPKSPRDAYRGTGSGNVTISSGADNVFFDGPPTIPGGQIMDHVIYEDSPSERATDQQLGNEGVDGVNTRLLVGTGANVVRSISDVGPRMDK